MQVQSERIQYINRFNDLEESKVIEEVKRCCSSQKWAQDFIKKRPFSSWDDMLKASETTWFQLSKEDWLEAFNGHAKIGDLNSLKKKYNNTKNWSEGEQKGVQETPESVLKELKTLNDLYEKKYAHIFIVCATGKTAEEMLSILKTRMNNDPDEELKKAAEEQNKITNLRLEKLLWEL